MELQRTVEASLDKLGRLLPLHSQIMAMLYGLDDGIPKTSKQVRVARPPACAPSAGCVHLVAWMCF